MGIFSLTTKCPHLDEKALTPEARQMFLLLTSMGTTLVVVGKMVRQSTSLTHCSVAESQGIYLHLHFCDVPKENFEMKRSPT